MNWISVKDRMPEPYQDVLVTDGVHIEQATYVNGQGIKWDFYGYIIDEEDITHWCEIELP